MKEGGEKLAELNEKNYVEMLMGLSAAGMLKGVIST
jgi:hypothetical protein